MSSIAHATESNDLVKRLRRLLSSVQQDCNCHATLEGALDRFSDLECRRHLRSALGEARRQREWITAQLDFLDELDEVTERETDNSVFEEMAALFDEIGKSAAGAARVIRDARSLMLPERDAS